MKREEKRPHQIAFGTARDKILNFQKLANLV